MEKYLKRLSAGFRQIARSQSHGVILDIFLDYLLAPYANDFKLEDLDKITSKIDIGSRGVFLDMRLAVFDHARQNPFSDLLGEFFMQEISHGHNGQFFTPENICRMIAQVTIPEPAPWGARVLDPACGSGRCLMAVAEMQNDLLFYGADIDRRCCKMAIFNMLANKMVGEISQLNSLTNEFYHVYFIGLKQVDGKDRLCFFSSSDPDKSLIRLRTKDEWSAYIVNMEDAQRKVATIN